MAFLSFALCVKEGVLNLYPSQVLTSLIEVVHPSPDAEQTVGEFTHCVVCFHMILRQLSRIRGGPCISLGPFKSPSIEPRNLATPATLS